MIRFLQKDDRLMKAFFVFIIALASIGMVVYLIPGLMGMGATAEGAYATIYPHWYSRFFNAGITISQQKVSQMARQQLERQRLPDSPFIVNYFEQQAGARLINEQVLLAEAAKLGIKATDDDVKKFLHSGEFGLLLFPNGKYIGPDRYADFVARQFNLSVADFEDEVRQDIIVRRLQALVTSGVSVSDQEVRNAYRKQSLKIKFDYAVISSEDLRKSINPSDNDLQGFFKRNAARYSSAVPERRQISYFAFTPDQLPGGLPQPSQQEVQQFYQAHQSEMQVPEQSRSRHILIKVAPGADAKTDNAAHLKADALLKQIQGGANFGDLAKKNSDDPGSKDSGGELGFVQRGRMVPEFDAAIFSLKAGESKVVKTQFGYHVVQVEERQSAHTQQLAEVQPQIQAALMRQKAGQAMENYARTLAAEATKSGLQKTAAAHHLELVSAPPVEQHGVISTLPDSAQLISKAFAGKQGDAAQYASTGEGFAIFQVTGIAAAHAPNFAEFKGKLTEDYRDEQLPALLTQKTKELADKAKSMGDLAKAAKASGASFKSSDLVNATGQVPDFGQVGQVAPQLFDLQVGQISGPINAQRTGVVAKLTQRQEPSADEIAKNFDQTKEGILEERRGQAFTVFLSNKLDEYKKHKRISMAAKAKDAEKQGM